jgi:undecaprenyl-diphosphatase
LTGVTLTGFLLVTVVKYVTKIPRPIEMYGGAVHWAFPSSHATMSLVTYGFLALLCSRKLPVRRRWLPFAFSLFLILGIGFSRLYLGAHWLSDVIGGFSLGSAWLIIMTICYLHGRRPWTSHGLFLYFLAVFVLAATVHWSTGFADNLIRYRQQHTTVRMSTTTWLDHGWRQLPAHRIDLGGEKEQTLNLQYAGTLPQLERLLMESDWIKPIPLTPATGLRWLMADPSVSDLPVLPQVHDGRNEVLLLIHALPESSRDFLALRLWPADTIIDNSIALRVGTLSRMTVRSYMNLIHLPRTVGTVSPVSLLPDHRQVDIFLRQTAGRTVLLIRTGCAGGEY